MIQRARNLLKKHPNIKLSIGNLCVEVLPALLPFFLLPIITDAISLSDYGEFILLITLITLASTISSLGLPDLFILDYFDSIKKQRKEIFTRFLITTNVVAVIMVLATLCLSVTFSTSIPINFTTITCSVLVSLSMNVSKFFNAKSQVEYKIIDYALARSLATSAYYLIAILYLTNNNELNFNNLLLCFTSAHMLAAIAQILRNHHYLKAPSFSLSYLIDDIKKTYLIFISGTLLALISSIDKFIADQYLGAGSVSHYAIAFQYSVPVLFIASATSRVLYSKFLEGMQNQESDFSLQKISKICGLYITTGALWGCISFMFIRTFLTDAYQVSASLSFFLSISNGAFASMMLLAGIYFKLKSKYYQVSILAVALIVNLTSNVLLIEKFGLYALVITTLIINTASFLFYSYSLNKK